MSSFHDLGFNFYGLEKPPNRISAGVMKKSKKPIPVNKDYLFQALLVDYSGVTSLVFPGSSGQAFYDLVKNMQIDWGLVKPATLSRFEINYCRDL